MCDHCGCRDLTTVRRLMDEHDELRALGDVVRRALADGDVGRARDHFLALLRVLGPHVAKEEKALFPLLARVAELSEHVAALEGEHADLFDAVDDLDDLGEAAGSAELWSDGVRRILHELDEHMFKEDFGLFPAALATLDGADWDAVDAWELAAGGNAGRPVPPGPLSPAGG
ncbi:hemerythrin domain-containing protein [Blastococcus sp. KM273128]|uniref:hemerythrin domain-containing protein n=1 Tax=Blastococcus sp. KM273128 TaxID=2570314 RepID=UPI00210222D6|nr:hemerythrin domain-containing protein [Blastococcus sp. KM273128]MCF6744714.1 hemerythrin domain-containing protein [Blastococcus sp. KM273128]